MRLYREPTPEVELLLRCARVELREADARRIGELTARGLDWDAVLDGAWQHGLTPLLHTHLAAATTPRLPPAAAARLRERAQRISALNTYLASELRALLSEFSGRGVPVIPYKGPALALEVYGRAALRQSCDLDILVRPRDVPAAADILRARGYAPHLDLGATQQDVLLRTQCNLPFTRDRDLGVVEIHWDVCAPDFGRPLVAEEFWARSRESVFGGAESRSLAPEDLLLALCVHGAKHRWEQLNWVCDIAQIVLSKPGLRWDELFARARRAGSLRMLLLGLRLAALLLDAPLPEVAREEIESDAVAARLAAGVREELFKSLRGGGGMGGYFKFQIAARERAADKLRFCRYALRPTEEDVSRVALPRALSFAYYAWRPLRLLLSGGPASLRRGANQGAAR